MDTCATTANMNKKRLTIQLKKDEEWILDKAHLLAEARSISLRQLVIELLTSRLEKDKEGLEELERVKGRLLKERKK